jgi:hypothetical protein
LTAAAFERFVGLGLRTLLELEIRRAVESFESLTAARDNEEDLH